MSIRILCSIVNFCYLLLFVFAYSYTKWWSDDVLNALPFPCDERKSFILLCKIRACNVAAPSYNIIWKSM